MSNSLVLPSIAFLGAGSMGGAILEGFLKSDISVEGEVWVTRRSYPRTQELTPLPGVKTLAYETDSHANKTAAANSKIVVLGVKPAVVPELLHEIADVLAPGTLLISMAAGITLTSCEKLLPESVAVIRAMPNTPARVGRAVTGLSAGHRSSETDMKNAQTLFETVGEVVVVSENKLDALSAISGSGPAYVFYLIEQLTVAAMNLGFTSEQAATLVNGTFRGSIQLLDETHEPPHRLRQQVTSPGGTTEQAIAVFESADLKATFIEATQAAVHRAHQLGGG